jgi:hypothetical protein
MKEQTFSSAHEPSKLSLARLLLHAEGAAALATALFLTWQFNGNWLMFVLLLLAPDLSMLGYLKSMRLGTITYNLAHTYIGPLLLLAVAPHISSKINFLLVPLVAEEPGRDGNGVLAGEAGGAVAGRLLDS